MAMQSPQAIADRWASGMSGAGAKAKAGVQALTESPTAAAARSIDRMAAGFARAASDGTIAAGLNSVSLSSWQNDFITKGIPRMASGAAAAKGKVSAFLTQFLPVLANNVANLPPRGDIEQNIARATAMMRANSAFKFVKPQS